MADNESTEPYYFTESGLPFGRTGIEIRTLVTETLYEEDSEYGDIKILDTPFYGKLLTIDGIIQTTVSDEFIYHEMMVYVPALRFGRPERMLIVGGGDGGAIKHALRMESLKDIVMVEIDTKVVDLSKKYLPELSDGAFDDPRVKLIIDDGVNYIREAAKKGETFDVIVLDLTDPTPGGPAEYLFTADFYREVKQALSPNGVVATHSGSLLFQPEETGLIMGRLKEVFAHVSLHVATVPAYQLSPFAFLNASDTPAPTPEEVKERYANITTDTTKAAKYITPELYHASTVLPPYMQQQISKK